MTHRERVREALAALAHQSWSGWMNHLFLCSFKPDKDGNVTIPGSFAADWNNQLRTQYCDLSEDEKESDREEADKVLAILDLACIDIDGWEGMPRKEGPTDDAS